MNYNEALQLLKAHSQEHVLKFYDELTEEGKKELLTQIENIDWSIFDILAKKDVLAGRGTFAPLGALEIDEIESKKAEFEAKGIEALRDEKIAAVLLAGGQGTRLGLDKPKGTLNVGVNKTLYLFEAHIKWLLSVKEKCGSYVPLYIMTSDINNKDTVDFFEEHNYFGYDKAHVKFFIQEMAPAVDFNGKIYMAEKGKLALSPNGNGGWFRSMMRAGLVDEMKEKGIEYLTAFSVDNVLQKINDPCFVGATIISGADIGAKVVKKATDREKIGVLCLEDGKPSIVEYYEITDEMANLRD
ncbi:MAG: UTP--glucose-1-phosphate uridylyltransferase, partial [Clostridia bacterium]|nr:UTP--glucose-1-phosphate uridylyltransferase [Clostridia bacterium]